MSELEEIGKKHGTDKGTIHSYLKIYEEKFEKWKNSSISLLELGVQKGCSCKMWLEYFKEANIIGIDIKALPVNIQNQRFTMHVCNVINAKLSIPENSLDIIIDDASHKIEQQLFCLRYFWKYLKPEGYYFIEDVQSQESLPQFQGMGEVTNHVLLKNGRYDDILVEIRKPITDDHYKRLKEEITLICIDCVSLERAIRVIEESSKIIEFKNIKLLSSIPNNYKHLVSIPSLKSTSEYSKFCMKELYKYVTTSHCLIIQHDGWILNPLAWNDNWLKYDYLGASTIWNGGNGGFSLRSKKILELMSKFEIDNISEDVAYATYDKGKKRELENLGCKYAPKPIQENFAVEGRNWAGPAHTWYGPINLQFGHHKCIYFGNIKPNNIKTDIPYNFSNDNEILWSIKLGKNGMIIGNHHENETYWEFKYGNLLFLDKNKEITTRFYEIKNGTFLGKFYGQHNHFLRLANDIPKSDQARNVDMSLRFGKHCEHGKNNLNPFQGNVFVGNYTSMAEGVTFLGNSNSIQNKNVVGNNFVPHNRKSVPYEQNDIYVGSDVWIGTNTLVLPGVTIGHGAIIGAGCVVSRDVPPYSVVVGNPQRIIRYRFPSDIILKLLKIKWWEWTEEVLAVRREYFQDICTFINKFSSQTKDSDPGENTLLSFFCGALLENENGRSFIQSEPNGASIFLITKEGRKDTGKKTPGLIETSKGTQVVELNLKGFEVTRLDMDIQNKIVRPKTINLKSLNKIKETIGGYPLTIKINNKIIKWIFGFPWDLKWHKEYILPWAFTGKEYEIVSDDSMPDFVICVYPTFFNLPVLKYREMCFISSAECKYRYTFSGKNIFQFVQDPKPNDDLVNIRYCSTLALWGKPTSEQKTKKCSIVESGKHEHRNQLISKLQTVIENIDIFGKYGNNFLSGYHSLENNDKYLGIKNHAFYISIENESHPDYITEKLQDAFISESCPIYWGANNVNLYTIDGSYIPLESAKEIDWNYWNIEYEKRRPLVLEQKELIRRRFNVFSYFNILTDHTYLLDNIRPITKDTNL